MMSKVAGAGFELSNLCQNLTVRLPTLVKTLSESWFTNGRQMQTVQHDQYMSNSEWVFLGYKYEVESVSSLLNKKHFSMLRINFAVRRNEPYYSITMFIPILVMTLLAPLGLILPVEAGEKMGLQITVLLTMVIYVEVLQSNIPVFDSYGNTPLMLTYFIVTICVICICLLVSTHTLFLYHVNSYESKNFSKSEAKISLFLAKIFNRLSCGIWDIEPPQLVIDITQHPTDDLHLKFCHEDLQHGFKFFADMINRFVFSAVILVQTISLFSTIIPAWVYYQNESVMN